MFSLERDLSNGLFEREPYPMENPIPINVPMAPTNGFKREPSPEPETIQQMLERLRHRLFRPPRT